MPKLPLEQLLTLLLDNLVWNKFGKNLDMEINLELHIPQQPSRGILRKVVLKICRKFTGEQPWVQLFHALQLY